MGIRLFKEKHIKMKFFVIAKENPQGFIDFKHFRTKEEMLSYLDSTSTKLAAKAGSKFYPFDNQNDLIAFIKRKDKKKEIPLKK